MNGVFGLIVGFLACLLLTASLKPVFIRHDGKQMIVNVEGQDYALLSDADQKKMSEEIRRCFEAKYKL